MLAREAQKLILPGPDASTQTAMAALPFRSFIPLLLLANAYAALAAPAQTTPAAQKPKEPSPPVKQVAPNKVIAILGQPVTGPYGKVVGRVVDVLVNDKGVPEAAVIDFGGFLGMGDRKIAVNWSTLHFNPGDDKYPVVLDLMPTALQTAPDYKGETKPAPVVVAPWEAKPAQQPQKPDTSPK
jgi:hypothetical protein